MVATARDVDWRQQVQKARAWSNTALDRYSGDALLLCTPGPPPSPFPNFLPGLNETVQEKRVGNEIWGWANRYRIQEEIAIYSRQGGGRLVWAVVAGEGGGGGAER